ncbi:MAG TPA: sigma factor [Puia sp.]|nr:sigma factor [Puia sp.]
MHMNLPDDAIVAGILSNDLNEAIFYIYKQYAELISFNVVTMGGGLQDREDIFQETVITFIDLARKNKFRGDSSIKTFLVSVAQNVWLNELKIIENKYFSNLLKIIGFSGYKIVLCFY